MRSVPRSVSPAPALLVASLELAAGCSLFDADRGVYSASVIGDQNTSLSGSGTFSFEAALGTERITVSGSFQAEL